jgi:hypothetical protein
VTAHALVLAPLACSVVLGLSGVAKARDAVGTREAFTALGVPQALRGEVMVRSLPYVEVGLALLLLGTWSWPLAFVAGATTLLFAAYWVLVLVVLRRGVDVDCGCFGAVGDDRVTGTTLARNSVLVALAGLATGLGVSGSGVPTVVRDLSTADAAWLAMTLMVTVAAVLVVGWRSPEPATTDDEDLLDYDRQAIPFALLSDSEGNRATLRELATGRAQLLVFLSRSCSSCVELAQQLPDWQSRLAPVEIQSVFTDELESLPENVTPPGIRAWYDVERGATSTFARSGRPAAVLLGADGLLAGGPVAGTAPVATFVEDILAELAAVETVGEGTPIRLDGHDHGHDHGREHGGGHGHGHGHVGEHDHQH